MNRSDSKRSALSFENVAEGPVNEQTLLALEGHQYYWGRCLRCDLRWIDQGLPGVDPCPVPAEDDPIYYITTTEGFVALSHPIL